MMTQQISRSEVLEIIDTYEGMIKLAWARGERAMDLLDRRTYWVQVLAGLS